MERLRPWLAPALLVAAHGGLLVVNDLAARPAAFFALLLIAFAALAWAVLGEGGKRLAPSTVLGIALLLRLLLLPLPATLSDDVLRYLWDGEVLAAGFNPYGLTPDDAALQGLRDADWEIMPHRDVEAVYPPLALGVFSIAAALPQPFVAWKLLLIAAELLGCVLLLRLAAELGLAANRVALYAWNPLVALEVAGMGHVDALGVTLVIVTVWALRRRRSWAGLAAAGSVLAKLVPVLAIPLWARHSGRRWRFASLCLLAVAAGLLPVLLVTGGLPPGWVRFGVSWEFNGPLYEPLWRLVDVARADDGIKAVFDGLKGLTGAHDFWNRFYPWVYPQLLAKGLLGGLLLVLLWRVWRDRTAHVEEATGRTFAALVLCSATVYPWYLLWMLPWAALCRQRAWLALSALVLLSYVPQTTALPLFPWVFAAIWIPFAFLLWWRPKWSID